MALRLFNTLTRRKEAFKPLEPGVVKMYSCGPTVYDYAHIGNLRAFMISDLITRYLRYKGFKVIKVMNLTDVDDKTILGSQKQGLPLKQYTEKYIEAFFEDLQMLNIEPASHYPRATEHIKEIVELIKKIRDKDHTYEHEGSIYFKIASFPKYGKLAHLDFEALTENAQGRLDSDSYDKENARDFVLWKAWKPTDGPVFWETELGKGRPGWHIECSAMSMKYLGESFDIHTGGADLIFPHHTNEIAQSESATGKPFVKYWLHNEYLMVEGQKMSKSLGNFYTLRDLLAKGVSPMAVRYALISTNFKMPLNFTMESLKAGEAAMERINNLVFELQQAKTGQPNTNVGELIEKTKKGFDAAMDDNLNISKALGILFDFVKELYKQGFSSVDAKVVLKFLEQINQVLGIISFQSQSPELAENVEELIKQRDIARANKDWATADMLRKQLLEKGIELFDSPEGTKWRKVSG